MTDDELSRAVAEKLDKWRFQGHVLSVPNFAADWSIIGPVIEKQWGDSDFQYLLRYHWICGEPLPRAACLAILGIDDV